MPYGWYFRVKTHLHVTMLASVGMVLSPMYRVAPGRDNLDPWLLSTQVLGELHNTYVVVTRRTQQEQMCSKLEKGAHKKQSELWDVGYKHEYPFIRQ